MHPDRPGPADRPPRAGPLDDLRERLARLPSSHPSSPEYAPPESTGPDKEDITTDDGGAAPAPDSEPEDGGAVPAPDSEPLPVERDDGAERSDPDGPGVLGRPGRARAAAGRARPGAPTEVVSPGPDEPYRPWFSGGRSPRPWFSAGPRDRSG